MPSKGLWVGIGIIIAVFLIAVLFLGLGKEKSGSPTSQVTPIVTPTPTPAETPSGDEETVREITIEATEFSFSTEEISVKKGEKIKLILVNKGKMSHDFVVERMNVTTELAGPGKSVSTEFTMSDAGTYTFYCSVGNHRAMGMEGTLTVTE